MNKIEKLNIQLFADGADKASMLEMYSKNHIKGLTTNPTLMKKSGITDYMSFAKEALSEIKDMPISFEVFSDELDEMEAQAYKLRDLAENVYVKIPVTNTKGETTYKLIEKLTSQNVKVNVTAIFTENQIRNVAEHIVNNTPSVISIFAGRIANTGIDPEPLMEFAVKLTTNNPEKEILWASPREALNIIQAERCGCDIITVTPDILSAMKTFGKDLDEFSLETVKMFYEDACSAGFKI